MAAAYIATIDPDDPSKVIVTSTRDGDEMNTTYNENQGTGGSNSDPETETTTEGAGETIVWSIPVQDGTKGIIGGRGPGNFTRAVVMTRPTTSLSADITAGEVTEVFGDFSSFENSGTIEIGTNPIQTFIYTSKGSGDLSVIGPSGQIFTTVAAPSTVSGFFNAPTIGGTDSAEITPSGGSLVTFTYNELALQTVCQDQNGVFQISGGSNTLANATTFGNTTFIELNNVSSFNDGGTAILENGTFDFTSKNTSTTPPRLENTEPQSVLTNTAGSSVTQAANSCSVVSGVPIGGDTVVATYQDSNEAPGNTTTLAALHDGTGIANDDWTAFELVIDGDLLVQGTVVAEALIVDGATLIPSPDGGGQLTVGQINADNINANQITTEKIAAGAATFDKIDLNGQLAVSTAGSGAISWGKNDADDVNSVGLFLGNANATNTDPRFVLGNASSYIWFDGDELYVVGATNTSPNLTEETYINPSRLTQKEVILNLFSTGGTINVGEILRVRLGDEEFTYEIASGDGIASITTGIIDEINTSSVFQATARVSGGNSLTNISVISGDQGDYLTSVFNSDEEIIGLFFDEVAYQTGFIYTISPTHSRLILELSGAGGGGGGTSGTAKAGEETRMTVQRRTRVNGVDTYSTRFGELGGAVGGGLTQSYTAGTNTDTVEVTTNEGFLTEGSIVLTTTGITTDLTTATTNGQNFILVTDSRAFPSSGSVFITGTNSETFNFTSNNEGTGRLESTTDTVQVHSIGDNVIGDSTGTFNYEERRAVPQSSTELTADIDGRVIQVTQVQVENASAFPATGSISFTNGETFIYNSIDTSGGVGSHLFIGNAQTVGFHNGTTSAETVESTTIVYSFFSSSAQDIGTHSTTVATTVKGNDHVFTAAGGGAGSSASFVNVDGDGEAGDLFDARVQTGDFSPAEGLFRGDGGTAGDFDGTKNGGIGGRGRGVTVNGETLDVSDGGGGAAATSVGGNDGGEGGEDGTYLTVFGSGYGNGNYTIVSGTDRVVVEVGRGGRGATGGTNEGGKGGDGAAQITGV